MPLQQGLRPAVGGFLFGWAKLGSPAEGKAPSRSGSGGPTKPTMAALHLHQQNFLLFGNARMHDAARALEFSEAGTGVNEGILGRNTHGLGRLRSGVADAGVCASRYLPARVPRRYTGPSSAFSATR